MKSSPTAMPATGTDSAVIDASYILSKILDPTPTPEVTEVFSRYAQGRLKLTAPDLLNYEVGNTIAMAVRKKSLSLAQAEIVSANYLGLAIPTERISAQLHQEILLIAAHYNLTTYDAGYLALATVRGIPLLTLDKRLQAAWQASL